MRIILLLSVCVYITAGAAFGQQAAVEPPDAIYFNGKVITVDAGNRVQEAFAVKGDRFLTVGTNASIKAMAGPKTRKVDLGGHAVIPGLMDNHTHQYNAAMDEFRGVDMINVPSLAEMLNRLRQAVAKAKPGEAIATTGGWNENKFPEKRGPTKQELDQIASDRVIAVFRGRGALYLNTFALKAAGVTRETKTVSGNPFQKDASGEPTGYFNSPAGVDSTTRKTVPLPPEPELMEMLRKIQDRMHSWGFTSVREVELYPEVMRAYQGLLRDGKLTLRIAMGLDIQAVEIPELDEILSPWGVRTGFGTNRLRIDSLGEIGMDVSNNAYLREPYTDRPETRGSMRITAEQLRKGMIAANHYGWRPAIHTMGDATLDTVLDAYEAANAESSIRERRWIVEHIPLVHTDQMERMARLGVVISAQIQPYGGGAGMIKTYGTERANHAVPMRELLDHKLIVSTGSDWGGGEADDNPFLNIYFYVTRKMRNGAVIGAAQKISREEALRVSTVNNAYMTFEENVKGSIETGKLADFVILSKDILTVPEEQIPDLKPLATYVGGQKVFASKDGGF